MAYSSKSVPHPYYPTEVEITGYLVNEYGVPMLLATFACGCTVIFAGTYLGVTRIRREIPTSELLTVLWFVLCGFIHTFFEGYYVYNFRAMGGMQDIFGQLWKEYSLSDSRYLTLDTFVLCMETITAALWGPLSFTVAMMIATEHRLRHPFQIIVSGGQLYGDVLYYATSMVDHYLANVSYCRPEPYYFWVYYFLMNIFWIIIPLALICSSVKSTGRAFAALSKMDRLLKANEALNKTK